MDDAIIRAIEVTREIVVEIAEIAGAAFFVGMVVVCGIIFWGAP